MLLYTGELHGLCSPAWVGFHVRLHVLVIASLRASFSTLSDVLPEHPCHLRVGGNDTPGLASGSFYAKHLNRATIISALVQRTCAVLNRGES